MRIKKLEIKAFRNIKNLVVDTDSNIVSFCGNNKLGKTNCINAIYWCLTGVSLDNAAGDEKNIPYGENYAEVSICADTGKYTRSVDYTHNQVVKLNDVEIKKTAFESTIYKATDKDFNEFRFFLNPMYLTQAKESDFRKWYLKHLDIDIERVFNKLDDLQKDLLADLSNRKFNIEETSKIFAAKRKEYKSNVEQWTIICNYLHQYQPTLEKDIKQAELFLNEHYKDLADIEQRIVTLNSFALELGKIYQSRTDVKLLEKGIGEDVWKEICRPVISGTNRYWFNGSTAEQKATLCEFVSSFGAGLPMLIDEAEIFDTNSLTDLKKNVSVDNQIFCARVVDGLETLEVRIK